MYIVAMKLQHLFLLGLILLLINGCRKSETHDQVDSAQEGYVLKWSDEFNYKGLPDPSKWSYDIGGSGWGNNEAQYYTDARLSNSEVKDGYLYVNTIKEDFEGKKYTSARLVTRSKGDWLYGRIEVKAKLPQGRGMWPAIWMLPTTWSYGGWPLSGEIDIMESLGHIPYFVAATAQTQSYNHLQGTQKNAILAVADCYTQFHDYILEWDTSEMKFYVDSKLYFTFKKEVGDFRVWPFDQPFHLILNVAVGGTYGGAIGIDDSIFPQSLVVDHVRVYQKK